jgi:response regulator of citrate/malate metabolism
MAFNPLVYLIDDDEVNYFLVKSILESLDPSIQVICFPTADAALQALLKIKNEARLMPAFILLDLYLPIKDGWYFIDHYQCLLENSFTASTVFILTCSNYPRDIEKVNHYTCIADFFVKPFTEELVKSKLHTFFQHSKQVYKG